MGKLLLIENLKLFLLIVEKGGLAAAGREMGLAPATVTERLAALETHYGASLLTRTTRSIHLTDEGRELMSGAKRILAEAEEMESRIRLGVEKLSGTIHMSAPVDLGRNRIAPLLDAFIDEHPEVSVDLTLNDGYANLVNQGLDLAIRFGDLADSSMKSRKLGRNRRLVCASPDYLKRFGTPQHPRDLAHHNCLVMRFGSTTDQAWTFVENGKELCIRVHGNRMADDGSLIRDWCVAGHGLSMKSEWDVRDDVANGRLRAVLNDFTAPPSSLQMVYPATAVQPRRVRTLMEFIAKGMKS